VTRVITLPDLDTARAWRQAARALIADGVSPDDVVWRYGEGAGDLFAEAGATSEEPAAGPSLTVPRTYAELADSVVWHSDPERFARLYAVLWHLRARAVRIDDPGDPDVARLHAMAKAVHRCQHKMKAFVRFREIGRSDSGRLQFAAWFQPSHFTLEPTAPFFARRFGDMDWRIVTPRLTASCRKGVLGFGPGAPRPQLPEDAAEALWATYFRSIFNPARLRVKAMQSQMPRKYWANMPETRVIPELVAGAGARVQAMREAAPTVPPPRAARIRARAALAEPEPAPAGGLALLRRQLSDCIRCPLHRQATQAVPGEGPADAALMIVGEQPGDQEDLAGRPFVGPAGRLFDAICAAAGLDRGAAYVTNAVKHFKFVPRGKRRLHQRPNSGEIAHCRWWLDHERALVRPRLILALGATAAEALTGSGAGILKRRGAMERTEDGTPVLLTVHPSWLLRLQDPAEQTAEERRFRTELERAVELLRARQEDGGAGAIRP
jgi:probable DNA metabolism protein